VVVALGVVIVAVALLVVVVVLYKALSTVLLPPAAALSSAIGTMNIYTVFVTVLLVVVSGAERSS
jgi:hypothetical protein